MEIAQMCGMTLVDGQQIQTLLSTENGKRFQDRCSPMEFFFTFYCGPLVHTATDSGSGHSINAFSFLNLTARSRARFAVCVWDGMVVGSVRRGIIALYVVQ